MADTKPTVFEVSEYEPQSFDAVLFREAVVLCLNADELVRVIPIDKVNHVDGDPDGMLVDDELPRWFFGGGEYGFVDLSAFSDLAAHVSDLDSDTY